MKWIFIILTIISAPTYAQMYWTRPIAGEAPATLDTIVFVGVGTEGTGDGANVTPTIPAGAQEGDILICVVHSRDNVSSSMTEFTEKAAANGGTTNRLTIFWKRHDGSEADPEVTHSGGNSIIAEIIAFRNCIDTGDPFDVMGTIQYQNSDPGPNTYTTNAITAGYDSSKIVHAGGSQDNNSWQTPEGYCDTLAFQAANSAGSDNSLYICFGTHFLDGGGSSGTSSLTQQTLGWDDGLSVQFALKKANAVAVGGGGGAIAHDFQSGYSSGNLNGQNNWVLYGDADNIAVTAGSGLYADDGDWALPQTGRCTDDSDLDPDSQHVYMIVKQNTPSPWGENFGIAGRMNATGDTCTILFYDENTGVLRLYYRNGTSYSQIQFNSATVNDGDSVSMTLGGTTAIAKVNSTIIMNETNAAFTQSGTRTKIGLAVQGNSPEDWYIARMGGYSP